MPRLHPRRAVARVLLIVTAMTLGLPGAAAAHRSAESGDDDVVTVASVQFDVDARTYATVARFEAAMDKLVGEATEDHDADLIVFPEYINVFLIAARYPSVVMDETSMDGAMEALALGWGISGFQALFERHAAWLSSQTRRIWSRLAREHDVTIIAGTAFVLSDESAAPELRNRVFVFDENGDLVYEQDKVYLTPMESQILRLDAASVSDARAIEVDGVEIGITVCRDTYFESWHAQFPDIDLWVDLRANGEPYSSQVYRRFLASLPERVRASTAAAGINASLTGDFLDLLWEGPSYLVDATGRRVHASGDELGTEIITVDLVPDDDEWRILAPDYSR